MFVSLNYFFREEIPVLPQQAFLKIDLNKAQAEDLMRIPRVSLKMALAIVEERRRRRGFKKIDELIDVSGIGPKILERLKLFVKI